MSAMTPESGGTDGAVGTAADKNETLRRQADEPLRWTEESFHLMVESVTDFGIVMLGPEGSVATWNSGAQQLLGYRSEEITGQHFSRFYPSQDIDRGAPRRDLDVAAANSRSETEGWRVRKDGSTFWANMVFTAIRDQSGRLRGFAQLTRDLTQRKKVEAELTHAKAAAEAADRAKSDFMSSMSHELRTPLNALLGFAQLMDSDAALPTPSQKEGLAQILQAGSHLLDLVNGVLDMARIESGSLTWSMEPVSLTELLAESRTIIGPQAKEKGIRIEFPHGDNPYFVWGDRTRVKQVLFNLLSNAVKYNRKDGAVVVECTAKAPQRVRLSVTDTGAGLSQEQRGQLFEPFNRLGQEAGDREGSGIGLVVSKRLVELMGGTIGMESTVGEGSVFWIELTATAPPRLANGDIEAIAPPRPKVYDSEASPRTLLYVEDNPANLQLVEKIISRRPDLRLLSARDGKSGIELARASRPDVILMDINLPGMSGIKAMQILHADAETAHIPVVALTANAMPRDIERGMQAGFFRYLTKPIKLNEFLETLDVALTFAENEVRRRR